MNAWLIAASQAILLVLSINKVAVAQLRYSSGQDVVPVYEGWERNPDGTFNMVFGYMNRNYEEQMEIPIGPDNKIEPGAVDQKQPSHFYPRRQEFVFKVKVPADWGDKDLVWTLVSRGKTEQAYGTLKPVYELGNLIYLENRHGAASLTYPEQPNKAPEIEMVGPAQSTIAPGEPLALAVEVMDDGNPKPVVRPPRAKSRERAVSSGIRTQSPASQAIVKLDPGVRLGVTWVVYRGGPGVATFDPMRSPVVTAAPGDAQADVVPLKGKAATTVSFSEPGTYVLRAYADDGILTTPVDVTVTVQDKR
jgi:hypothetical protein